ncbi:MAG: hypothetical protein ABIH46_02475 [Chloroflexota bacterium]
MATENQPQVLTLPGLEAGPLAFLLTLALMPLQVLQGLFQGFNSMMASGQLPLLSPPFATARSNDEVEEIVRDERGFIVRRTVRRVVR